VAVSQVTFYDIAARRTRATLESDVRTLEFAADSNYVVAQAKIKNGRMTRVRQWSFGDGEPFFRHFSANART